AKLSGNRFNAIELISGGVFPNWFGNAEPIVFGSLSIWLGIAEPLFRCFVQNSANTRIFFKFPLEKPRKPGNSFCNSVEICSKTLLPQASFLAVRLIFFPISKYKDTSSLLTKRAA